MAVYGIAKMYRDLYRRSRSLQRELPLAYFPFSYSGDPLSRDRFNWPVDALSDYRILDWSNNDGLTPFYGPPLTMDGTVVFNKPMPGNRIHGEDILGADFGSAGLLKATTGLPTISATDDWYIAILLRVGPDDYDTGILRNILQFGGNTSPGTWDLRANNQTLNLVMRGDTTIQAWAGSTWSINNSFGFYQVSIDKDGDVYYFINNYQKNVSGGCPSGSIYNNTGFSISGYHDSLTYLINSNIARVMIFAGPGLADICQADTNKFMFEMYYSVIGLHPRYGAYPTFTRNELSSQEQKSKLYFYGYDCPMVGEETHFSIEPAITQKCYRNYDQDTGNTGLILSAGSFTWVDESSSLASATVDISVLGPKVAQFANSSGSDQYITSGATTGNTNPHSLSGYVRITAGSGARIGFLHTGGTVFQDLGAVGSDWDRLKIEDQTPAATDAIWCVMVPNGCTVQLTGQQLEEFKYSTAFLPNNLTAATVSRTTDSLVTDQIIDNDKGRIEFDFKSKYVGNVSTLSRLIVPSSTGTRFFFIYNFTVRSTDGTDLMIHPTDICDGNWHHITISWDASISERKIIVDSVLLTGPYDGAWAGASETFKIGGHVGFCEFKNFKVFSK